MVAVKDVEKVFRLASTFYHSPPEFYDVLEFGLEKLGVGSFGLLRKDKGKLGCERATERASVVAVLELWKLILPDNVYSIVVEAYYAVDDCDDLGYRPLWYRVVGATEGDLEKVGEDEAEEDTGEEQEPG
jgi:hypothetical protein